MGSDPASFFSKLFLYYYGNKWFKKVNKYDVRQVGGFANLFRFIDDLTMLNDWG